MNVTIYNGPDKEFTQIIPNSNISDFMDLIIKSDKEKRSHEIIIKGQEVSCDEAETEVIENLIVHSNDYSSVAEHVIENFIGFLKQFKINNLFIQNPPMQIYNKLLRFYPNTKIKNYKYKNLNINNLKNLNNNFSERIVGQESVKEYLLSALYPLSKKNNNKPVVIMFYGSSGVGKTETAKYIAEILKGKILRKQFSMFQNNEFSTYLFGGKYSERSFTKDLLERESNVILLDEFDKCNSLFHSAFYELFDEGIMEDKNYRVDVRNSIIICTSNYKSLEDIRTSLGDPIYSRFDSFIRFNNLDVNSICKIIDREYRNQLVNLSKEELQIIKDNSIEEKLIFHAASLKNVREIKNIIKEVIYLSIIREIL